MKQSNQPSEALAYSYDLDGDTLTASDTRYTYPGGQQHSTTVASDSYSYDSFGRLVSDGQSLAAVCRPA